MARAPLDIERVRLVERLNIVKGSRNIRKFALATGIKYQNLYAYLHGAEIGASALYRIAKVEGINLNWLITGRGPMREPLSRADSADSEKTQLDQAIKYIQDVLDRVKRAEPKLILDATEDIKTRMRELGEGPEEFVPVPYMEDRVAAGPPLEVADHRIRGYVLMYKAKIKHPKETFAVQITGTSMSPLLPDGAIVGVDSSQRDPMALMNRIVLASDGEGGATVKRLRQDATHWILQPENPEADTLYLDKARERNPVIGKVIWYWAEVK